MGLSFSLCIHRIRKSQVWGDVRADDSQFIVWAALKVLDCLFRVVTKKLLSIGHSNYFEALKDQAGNILCVFLLST